MKDYIHPDDYMRRYALDDETLDRLINDLRVDTVYDKGQLLIKDDAPPEFLEETSLEDMIIDGKFDLPSPPSQPSPAPSQALSTDLITMSQIAVFKDENKEILRFSEKSLNTMASYTQTIFNDKERIISFKETQISELKDKLGDQDKLIKLLKQQLDDFHLLTNVVTQNIKK